MAPFALFFTSLHVSVQVFFLFFCFLHWNEWEERKKSVLHAGNITTGATYTPLLLVGFVFTYSAYYGNANGDVWVVAQQTLSFIKPLALQHILDQINANQLFCRKYIYFENHLPQNATQQIFAGMIFALCSSDNPKKKRTAHETNWAGDKQTEKNPKTWSQLKDTLLL